ncbi:MAG TPA: TadE/TadG family type IV pilus assembly protein [Pirellulales bacterium]|nr:TadE/TadG family type IV pilus assembly protein [Pirellulales bacterium]
MTVARMFSALQTGLRGFVTASQAVSAVEFALILPVMVTLYIGGVQVATGMAVQFKSVLAARTVAGLASRYTTIDTPTMSSILNAGFTLLNPYPTAGMSVTVSEVSTDAKGNATITWSCSLGGTPHTFGAAATLPNNVNAANISILWGEVTYPYTPQLGYVLTGTINMYEKNYFYPRFTSSVSGPSAASACPAS